MMALLEKEAELQEIVQLVDGNQTAGYHEIEWDASTLSSGIYFYRISVSSSTNNECFEETKRMIFIK